MKRTACVAAWSCLLTAVVAACTGANGTSSGSDAGISDASNGSSGSGSGSGSGAGSGSGSSSGSSSSGAPTDGGGHACDSGGPLVLESVWKLPTVTPSGIAFDGQGDLY